MLLVSRGPATDRSGGEWGKLGEGGEAVDALGQVLMSVSCCPATTDQQFAVAPCTSSVTLFSMYNVMVLSHCPRLYQQRKPPLYQVQLGAVLRRINSVSNTIKQIPVTYLQELIEQQQPVEQLYRLLQ